MTAVSPQLPAMGFSLIRGDTLRLTSSCCICVSLLLSLCIFYICFSSFHSFLPPSPLSCYQFFPGSLNVQCLQTAASWLLNCFSSDKALSPTSCSPLCALFYNQGEEQELHFFLTYLKAAVILHPFSFLLTGSIGMGQVMSTISLEMWMCETFNRLGSHFNTSSSAKLIPVFLKVISFMTQIAVCPIKSLFSPKK